MADRKNKKAGSSNPGLLFCALPVWLFCLISLFSVSCATRPVAIQPDDPLFGTWVNEQHEKPGCPYFAKKVISPDGRELDFDYIAGVEPARECRNTVEKTWIDADGNHWYHIHTIGWQLPDRELEVERFTLCRVSAQGTVLEQLNAKYYYPEELDPTDVNYAIYYIKE